MVSKD